MCTPNGATLLDVDVPVMNYPLVRAERAASAAAAAHGVTETLPATWLDECPPDSSSLSYPPWLPSSRRISSFPTLHAVNAEHLSPALGMLTLSCYRLIIEQSIGSPRQPNELLHDQADAPFSRSCLQKAP